VVVFCTSIALMGVIFALQFVVTHITDEGTGYIMINPYISIVIFIGDDTKERDWGKLQVTALFCPSEFNEEQFRF